MKRKLSPRPWHQAEQMHRRRKALGRALHEVRAHRWRYIANAARGKLYQFKIPRLVRKHAPLLRYALIFGA